MKLSEMTKRNWSDFARRSEKGARNALIMTDAEIERFAANLGKFMREARPPRPAPSPAPRPQPGAAK
jgi:hypothetical protein